jgi:hypothetical protein
VSAWELPPFPPDVKTSPGGYSLRVSEGYPLGQDPLGWAMAVVCDADHEQLHGPMAPPGPELGLQLDALCKDYQFTNPADHPERVRWLENAQYVDVDLTQWEALGGTITYELARLDAPGAGLLRVETIATYLRYIAGESTVLLAGSGSDNATTITEPFPFPLVVNESPLTRVWDLVEMMVADTDGGPAWARGITRAQAVPATAPVRAPWNDNRYAWTTRWAGGQQHTVGGRALVRLFVTLEHPTPLATFAAVRVGGGLKGFAQSAGRRSAAVTNTTLRI